MEVPYSSALLSDSKGLNTVDLFKMVKAKYNKRLSLTKAKNTHEQYRKFIYSQAKLLPGTRKLLKAIKSNGAYIALGTSSPLRSVKSFFKKHNTKVYFNAAFSTVSLKLPGKPHPAVYNALIKNFKCSPNQTVIIEDSSTGFKAAKASGAKVIAVPEEGANLKNFQTADLIATSLADKKIYEFLGLK